MRARHLLPAALTAVLLTGCGANGFAETVAGTAASRSQSDEVAGSLPTPRQLAHDTVAVLAHVRSVDITERDLGHALPLVTEFSIDGADWKVSVGEYFEAVVVGGTGYVRGGADFWTAKAQLSPRQADAVAWRWVNLPGTAAGQIQPPSLDDAVAELSGIVRDTRGATVERGRLAGRPIYILTLAGGGAVKIAANGPPVPLEAADGGLISMIFSGFDQPLEVAAPSDAVDISELIGG
jgi:hypothetical protein